MNPESSYPLDAINQSMDLQTQAYGDAKKSLVALISKGDRLTVAISAIMWVFAGYLLYVFLISAVLGDRIPIPEQLGQQLACFAMPFEVEVLHAVNGGVPVSIGKHLIDSPGYSLSWAVCEGLVGKRIEGWEWLGEGPQLIVYATSFYTASSKARKINTVTKSKVGCLETTLPQRGVLTNMNVSP